MAGPREPQYTARARVPFIDREHELAELHGALSAARAGSGRLVLLGGEPGIGKTRLVSVLVEDAESFGVPVWWGRGWEDGPAPAFWPWNTALRRWIDRVGEGTAAAAAGAWSDDLAGIFPALRDPSPDLSPSERWASDGARFRLFDLANRFLAAVAGPAGLVVVLDDVHWMDRPSLELLEFVTANLAGSGILVVAAYRDTEVQRDDPFFATLSRLAREPSTRRLLLGGLSPAHCARWVSLAGIQGDAEAVGEALHRETNGNPFFLGELVHLLATGDQSPPFRAASRVPDGVREVIVRRLDRLGDDYRTSLAVAALLGDTIDAGVLSEVLAEAALADHLALAVRDRVLVESEGCPGRYAFAHALVRRVLADELSASARIAWHARIAAVLERMVTTSETVSTELVRHLAAVGTAEALRKAFDHASEAGECAARGRDWEEAVRLHELALDLGRRCALLDSSRAVEVRLALARALRGAGDVPAARARCEEVMVGCRRVSDPGTFARAALIHAGPLPEWGRVDPATRAVLEEACRSGSAIDDELRARLYARLGGDLVAAGEVEQGQRVGVLCDEAVAAARRADAPGALAIALMATYSAASAGMLPAASGRVVPSSHEILEAAELGGEHEYAAAVRYARAMTLMAIGESGAFSGEVDSLATAAASSRVPEARWLAEALAALRATVQGRFVDAGAAIERAFATGRQAQLPNVVGVHMSQRIMWHALQGRLIEIGPELDAFVDGHPGGAGWRPFRALARLGRGDVVAARAEFQDLLATGLTRADRGVMARTYLMGMAALCVGLRDGAHAPALYDRIARRPDAWSVGGCQTLGPWALVLGSLARLCGNPDEAVRHFETAIDLGRRMGSPPIVARAQSLLASLLVSLRPGQNESGRVPALLAEAAQCARELELADVAARVARVQARHARGLVAPDANAFRCAGDMWTVSFAGRQLCLKDGKGPRYLATLLGAPGREVHVFQFMAPDASPMSAGAHDGLSIGLPGGSVEDSPDESARRAYRARLADLEVELDQAERFADRGRAEVLRAELDHLVAQLAGRFGGRAVRRAPAETARKAVTKVLRTQIGKLLDLHPVLGRHLRAAVRMGTICVYAPLTPVDWDVAFGPA